MTVLSTLDHGGSDAIMFWNCRHLKKQEHSGSCRHTFKDLPVNIDFLKYVMMTEL